MLRLRHLVVILAAYLSLAVPSGAQTLKAYLNFNGNTNDTSGAGIITSISASAGWTPTFTTDRNGVASNAIDFSTAGGRSLQLIASSLVGNSAQALGLRNAGGTGQAFTIAAWVKPSAVNRVNTVAGLIGSGAGAIHAGLSNTRAQLAFENANDATGATAAYEANVWFHLAVTYDGTTQRLYVNGVPELTRTATALTMLTSDVYVGNWGTVGATTADFRGVMDDLVIYTGALTGGQIVALYDGVSPTALPATYNGPKLPGVFGTAGQWGVREIKGYSGIAYGTLVNADRIIRAYPTTPSGTKVDYLAPVLNMTDPEGAGNLGFFASESPFGTNTGAADDSILMIARCAVRIPAAGNYTFGFRGDDGSRLRVIGQQFASSTRVATANPANPAHNGDGISYPAGAGDSQTLGVVNFAAAGDYAIEYEWWEGGGGSSLEVFAAAGSKTSVDSAFQLIGNTAVGGLEIVRDPTTVPTFTVNGGSSLFIHSGSPATFTLAWAVTNATTALSINQGIGAVASSGSQVIAAPGATTTYTLTATTPIAVGNDVNPKSVTVYVNSAPIISSFAANDTTVTSGAAVTLSWATDGATSLTLQPGNINVTGTTTRVVNPTSTTTYTLQATNPSGTTSQQVTVTVGAAPAISSFTVSDANPLYNEDVLLSWNVASFDTLSINSGVGTVTGATGSVSVVPLLTTTYTMSATNIYGTSTANATVTIATPIGVTTAGFTVQRFNSTLAFPYAGMTYLPSALALVSGTNQAATTTVTGVTTINYSAGVDGNFTTGNAAFPTLAGGQGDDSFALKITGTLVVNTPGEYTFVVNCDDGARLRIDGQDVIVDDGTHAPGGNSGSITLTKPTATIELIYYDATGNAEVELAWIRPNLQWQLLGTATAATPIVRGSLLISEFMADSASAPLDEDGASSDWIEIWNSTNATINLSGYFLTDDALVPNKWAFPAWTLGPNQYAIVFASLKNRTPAQAVAGQDNPGTLAQPRLHTNFKISSLAGSYLALKKSNGAGGYDTITVFSSYPEQKEDVSYGSTDSEGYIGYMETPTPGFTNAVTYSEFVKDTVFSHQRGRYSAPFSLTLSTATAGATIRYTTDGSTPSITTGNIYTGPIAISSTTVVRAGAFKPGAKGTNVDTKTYLFVDDIVNQTTATSVAAGFPAAAVNGQVYRYGMALANVTAGGGDLNALKAALAAAPSICMNTDIANLTSASTGIYSNPGQHGLFWERPTSLEMINAAGTSEFQINCGVRIRGGASRNAGNPKHAFHLYFRGLYDGNLKYRLFGTNGAAEFDQIDMRCEQNNSWSKDNSAQNALIREEWGRLTQRDMGQPYARNGYFHLYINGVYWGVFNWEERTEAAFGESYLGGVKDSYDTVKSAGSSGSYNTEMTDGNFAAWQSLFNQSIALKNDVTSEASRTAKYMQMRGLNPDGTRNLSYPVLLDVDNLIDYQLTIFYDGSFDAPMSTFLSNASNNWFGIRDRAGERGWTFYVHDNEHGMDSTGTNSYNRIGPWGGSGANNWSQTQYGTRETFAKSNPHYLHELLCYSAEYRQRFADRVQRHCFNGGALTTTASVARVSELSALIDPIIHAEAARWGSASLHKNTWQNTAKAAVLNFINNGGAPTAGQTTWATQPRTGVLLEQLRGYQDPVGTAKALFSAATLSAPTISGQFGGIVANGYPFTLTNPNATGTLYYTTNGVDPRAVGGGIAPTALTGASPINVSLTQTGTVMARVYDSGTGAWSALIEPEFIVGTPAAQANLVISQIHYNPASAGDLEEFIEVMNISAGSVDLTGCHFTLGITFTFPDGLVLAPGARALVVRDMAAFTAAYPTVPVGQIAGVFDLGTVLDNGGEQLQLLSATNAVIRDFSYGDSSPWPKSADGDGPSLVFARPLATPTPDQSLGTNWRPSFAAGGSPGVSDSTTYAAWATANGITDPAADDDGDGLVSIAEYALGGNPNIATTGVLPVSGTAPFTVSAVTGTYLTLTYTRPIGRDNVSYFVEGTATLGGAWSPAVQEGKAVFNGNGTETLVFRYPDPIGTASQFLRLRMLQLP